MSVILTAGARANRKLTRKRQHEMSERRQIVRKAGEADKSSGTCLTSCWEFKMLEGNTERPYRVSFSRDTLNVWVNRKGVNATAFVSDADYDVDLFFDIDGHEGHIFSDVDDARKKITNTLIIDKNNGLEEIELDINNSPEHFRNIRG